MSETKRCYKCLTYLPVDKLKALKGNDGKRRWCCASCIARSRPSGFPGRLIV
ncbi:hypothetical protein UFOVP728_21 [uncultured Caudovirales phage]|uniref:Uncharacterized protein n=1 Tax=uncultured Caudovirales phage TaxID=2100421 RepID=A0A6J5NV68_9CAUD|nr:hypothetical protein UFOVP728_21 [uncultured Caudovirales phage]